MVTEKDKAIVITELIQHAEHGRRSSNVSVDAYEWRLSLLSAIQARLGGSDEELIDIVHGSLEGEYHAKN